MVDNVI